MSGQDGTDGEAGLRTSGWMPRTVINFLIWVAAGFLVAFAVASMASIGLLVLPFAVAVLIVAILVTRGGGWPGVLVGAGLVGLLVAWMNAAGPGEVCLGDPPQSCHSYFDPVPFLVLGVLSLIAGVVIELWVRRVRRPDQ